MVEPRTSNLKPRTGFQGGFTLMELMVVIAILSLIAGIVLPRLPSTESAKLRDSARSLASAIRFIGDRAATTKTGYRLHLNITDSTTRVRQLSPSGEETAADDPFLSRRPIAEGITIEDVTIPQSGKISEGEVIIGFGPGGLQDFMIIHLKDGKNGHFTVTAYPSSGKVKVEKGYQEAAQ
ncbi:pilus assembly FimT family protein [Geotalea toluenoxydans]|uniref:pilus assembly FimT family protein n=1 Tax=Geotalea toluenoxydans TaxID=421624 RepID=UPI002436D810|nr:prepilin-type N-terminal cleavage/methylation domain-containing protein [Geotalea toluenoxydans]